MDSNLSSQPVLIAGNSNQKLANKIAEALGTSLLCAKVSTFSDGELDIELTQNVRGMDVFIIQSTSTPAEKNLMELLLIADAARRSSARRITAIMPYFGYARQDRRIRSSRVPISARVVADMISNVGIDRVLTVDLHAEQIQGFFSIPVDNVYGVVPLLVENFPKKDLKNSIIVSPDIGGVVRARAIAKRLHGLDLAIIDKRRQAANQSEVMNIIGDVKDRHCILVDDIVDTAGTLCHAANALKEQGAAKVEAYATHAILSGNALTKISESHLDRVIVTDTVELSAQAEANTKIQQLSISDVLATAIHRVYRGASISALFK